MVARYTSTKLTKAKQELRASEITQVNLKVPAEFARRLAHAAIDRNQTHSALVMKAVEYFLKYDDEFKEGGR